MRRVAGALLILCACGGSEEMQPLEMKLPDEDVIVLNPPAMPSTPALVDPWIVEQETEVVAPPAVPDGPRGFIGSPCVADNDCSYEGGVCLRDGFPRGTCSSSCDRLCPDRDGFPVTFCAGEGELPRAAFDLAGAGACLPRCDFDLFPESGCREGYGCTDLARANEPTTRRMTCLPGAETMISPCLMELAAMGVDFEPTVHADDHPDGHPELTCHIEDPLRLRSPVHGVELAYYDGSPTATVLLGCRAARALVKTIDDMIPHGVRTLRHYGTYNCRLIAGTDRLSRHGLGDAVDIAAFELDDGSLYTVLEDYEQDDDTPETAGGIFLYEAVHRWYDARLWSIILTPNYNAAHRNHFHVDLTPGSHVLNLTGGVYLGPNIYGD
jgi:hypothetical protein